MPTHSDTEISRPDALHAVSDIDKANAISAVCKALTGQIVDAQIEMIDYSGRLGFRGPFRQYSEIRFTLAAPEDGSPNSVVDALQQVDDETLADAIASQLGKLAGERYKGYIAMKRIGARPRHGAQVADVRIQLAKA